LTEAVLEARDISYCYTDGVPALRQVSFCVEQGECVVILGANASGKSTLLHLLDGLYFPTKGSILVLGVELTEETVETPPFSREFRSQVGFLFQNADAQLFCNTVAEELSFGPLQLRLDSGEIEQRVDGILELFGISHLRERSPQTLSGGEKKKVALASVMVTGPTMLLLDEPTGGLDPRSQRWLVELIKELQTADKTLVIATHDLSIVEEIAGRVLVLSEDGRLVAQGPPTTILDNTELLLSANLIHEHVHAHGEVSHRHPHGHYLGHRHPHQSHEA